MKEQLDGYVFDYFGAEDSAYDPKRLLEQGFYPRGTKVRLSSRPSGWEWQHNNALEKLGTEKTYTVKWCRIGGWSSSYEFEEVPGGFNHVMFERVE